MNGASHHFPFVGRGTSAEMGRSATTGPWRPDEYRYPVADETAPGHPAGYFAGPDLVDAVNTALLLNKPLLLTGNPGTGKSDLAQRIAWEFDIGPVLRFEAQSLSEANDLFYRFDLVRHVAASHTARPAAPGDAPNADPKAFISFGPLGKAILRSNPHAVEHAGFWNKAFPKLDPPEKGERSVVLIDEIDKASRDFPNDLLNAIERLEVPVREIPTRLYVTDDAALRPIIVITCNLERELPDPFLRRCIYFHIPDPLEDVLRRIVLARVFPESLGSDPPGWLSSRAKMPELFEQMLGFFLEHRDQKKGALAYASGPAELIDWSNAVRASLDPAAGQPPSGDIKQHEGIVRRSLGALAKHRDDRDVLLKALRLKYDFR